MKKRIKIIALITGILAFMLILQNSIYAASINASISASEVEVGDTFTVSISGINGRINVTGSNVSVSPSTTFVEGSATITCTETASGTGTGTIIPVDVTTTGAEPEQIEESVSRSLTIKAAPTPEPEHHEEPPADNVTTEPEAKPTETEKSRNNYLSSIYVSAGTLTPSFNRETQDYTLVFDDKFDFSKFDKLTVDTTLEDEKASKTGGGTVDVVEGENSVSIRVTAENGINYRTYVIKFTKPAQVKASDLKLSTLVINMKDADGKMTPATLTPNFKPDVFEYTLKVGKDVEDLSITPTTDMQDVDIKVDGGKKLMPGKNVVTITLTSKKDNKIISKYVINVIKEAEETGATNEENNKGGFSIATIFLIVAGIALLLLLIVLVIMFVIMKKNRQIEEDENLETEAEGDEVTTEAELSQYIKNFDKPVEEEKTEDLIGDVEMPEPKLEYVDEEPAKLEEKTEEPKPEIDFSKDPDEFVGRSNEVEKPDVIETSLDDIRETERRLDDQDPRGRGYRGKRFE